MAQPHRCGGGKVGFSDIWGWDRVTGETLEETIERQWEEERDYAGTAVREIVEAAIAAHGPQMGSYCAWMAPRLIEMARVLTSNGGIWLHCDPTASHYLKALMDAIFGPSNFRNEIVWHYYNKYAAGARVFGRNYDQLLFYAGGDYTFNPQREKRDKPVKQLQRVQVDGVLKNKRDEDGNLLYRTVTDRKVDAVWRIPAIQPAAKDYLGYPTQKHIRLLERIIATTSNADDVVLDPFCGCATACIAAAKLERRWIGIDVEPEAVTLCRRRLANELQLFDDTENLTEPPELTEERQLELIPRNQRLRFELWKRLQESHEAEQPPCPGCGNTLPGVEYMEVDHIVPRSKGGEHTWDNVQLLCGPCNRSKGNKSMAQWRRDRALTGSR